MRAHFRHLCSKSFPIIWGAPQSNGFWPLQSLSEDLGVHRDFNFQSGSSFGSVRVHSLTLSCTPESMKCDSRVSYLARTFASLALVTISRLGLWQNMGGLQLFKKVFNIKTMLKWMFASWEMPWLCRGRMIKRLLIALMPKFNMSGVNWLLVHNDVHHYQN